MDIKLEEFFNKNQQRNSASSGANTRVIEVYPRQKNVKLRDAQHGIMAFALSDLLWICLLCSEVGS